MCVRAVSLQTTDVTREKQLQLWKDLIVSWHMANRQTVLVVGEWPHFENRTISRTCCCICAGGDVAPCVALTLPLSLTQASCRERASRPS